MDNEVLYSAVTHEVKTSLLCLSSMLREMLRSGEYTTDKIAMCEWQMTGLANYLTQMSSVSQPAEKPYRFKMEAVSLRELAELIRSLYQPLVMERGSSLTVRVAQEAYEYLYLDRILLIHILNNLVTNAVKYSRENGSIVVTLSSDVLEEYRAGFHVSVRDNGIGMSEDFRKRAFELYAREGRNASDGNGVGLAVVKLLAKEMNGNVRLDTEIGEGTMVTIDFEVDGANEYFAKPPVDKKRRDKSAGMGEYDFSGRKILVAEDNEIFMNWIAETLERHAMAVDKTYDGVEVTELFCASTPGEYDAILMDLSMPEMDGLEAAARIRACDRKDAQTIPILAFTGMPIEDEEVFLAKHQMQAVVPKVFDEAAFLEIFAGGYKNGG